MSMSLSQTLPVPDRWRCTALGHVHLTISQTSSPSDRITIARVMADSGRTIGPQALSICASDTLYTQARDRPCLSTEHQWRSVSDATGFRITKVDRGPLDYHTTLTKNLQLYYESDSYTPQNFPLSKAFQSCNLVYVTRLGTPETTQTDAVS